MGHDNEQVPAGRIVRPHGRYGELKVRPYIPFPHQVKNVTVVSETTEETREITGIRQHQGHVLLSLSGIATRAEAEGYRGYEVIIPRSAMAPLPTDTYYLEDLIGCRVLSDDGDDLGEVFDSLTTSGVDLLLVRKGEHEWMLPTAKAILRAVCLEDRVIRVSLPEGLMDLTC